MNGYLEAAGCWRQPKTVYVFRARYTHGCGAGQGHEGAYSAVMPAKDVTREPRPSQLLQTVYEDEEGLSYRREGVTLSPMHGSKMEG
jgi:hypothetical protein